jgi:hypothetical protein
MNTEISRSAEEVGRKISFCPAGSCQMLFAFCGVAQNPIADSELIEISSPAQEADFRFAKTGTRNLMAAIETIPPQYSHRHG